MERMGPVEAIVEGDDAAYAVEYYTDGAMFALYSTLAAF